MKPFFALLCGLLLTMLTSLPAEAAPSARTPFNAATKPKPVDAKSTSRLRDTFNNVAKPGKSGSGGKHIDVPRACGPAQDARAGIQDQRTAVRGAGGGDSADVVNDVIYGISETSTTSITFLTGLNVGDIVEFVTN